MQSATTNTPPSVTAILYALIVALIPFIESLEAQAIRTGRPISPALRRLARTVAAMRRLCAFFGKPIPAPRLRLRRTARAQPAPPIRHPDPHQAPKPSRHAPTPEPTRTLEL